MKQRFYRLSLHKLLHQRDRLMILGGVLVTSNLLLTLLLFCARERIVITPPVISKSFWVDGRHVSPAYLEEMAVFFARQILDLSPSSASYQRDVALRYVAPCFHNALRKRLMEEEERAREGQISTSFKPVQIKVDPGRLEAELTGDLLSYVGGKNAGQARETYLMRFQYAQGRLLIKHFALKKETSS